MRAIKILGELIPVPLKLRERIRMPRINLLYTLFLKVTFYYILAMRVFTLSLIYLNDPFLKPKYMYILLT